MALGSAQAELHDSVSAGCVADAGGLGGDQALVIDDIEDRGLHQLRLHDRRDDLDDGLAGEDQGTFRQCVDAAGEFELRQVREEILVENIQAAQIFDILFGEVQLLDVFDELFDAAENGVGAAEGAGSEKGSKMTILS